MAELTDEQMAAFATTVLREAEAFIRAENAMVVALAQAVQREVERDPAEFFRRATSADDGFGRGIAGGGSKFLDRLFDLIEADKEFFLGLISKVVDKFI